MKHLLHGRRGLLRREEPQEDGLGIPAVQGDLERHCRSIDHPLVQDTYILSCELQRTQQSPPSLTYIYSSTAARTSRRRNSVQNTPTAQNIIISKYSDVLWLQCFHQNGYAVPFPAAGSPWEVLFAVGCKLLERGPREHRGARRLPGHRPGQFDLRTFSIWGD